MRTSAVAPLLMVLVGGAALPAAAHEVDPLTGRGTPLPDAAPVANALLDGILADAAAATNRRLGCGAPAERTRRVLAAQVYRRTGPDELVWHEGFRRAFGHGRYSALLETDPRITRLDFPHREDLFGDISLRRSVILHTIGPASTVNLAGVWLGTDKVNHFFAEGYTYARKSDWGLDPARAYRWGTRTERTYYGKVTSKAFSWADLEANAAGFRFYTGLLEPGSVLGQDAAGCVVPVRSWDWAAVVAPSWDEAQNPPHYTRPVQEAISDVLEDRREEACAAWEALGGEAYSARLEETLSTVPSVVVGRHPPRIDPFTLGALCGEERSAAVSPADGPAELARGGGGLVRRAIGGRPRAGRSGPG